MLPRLRGGEVHLEHAERFRRIGIPVRERVEPRSQHDVLADPGSHRGRERILGAAAARNEERPQQAAEARLVASRIRPDRRLGFGAHDPERDRIVEHQRMVENLMRRTSHRDPVRGRARPALFHGEPLSRGAEWVNALALALDQRFPAGRRTLEWIGRADGGRRVPPAVYFVRVRARGAVRGTADRPAPLRARQAFSSFNE